MGLGKIDQPSSTYLQQIFEKKWKYNNEVCQLFKDFAKAYDSIKREPLYNILIKFGIPKND